MRHQGGKERLAKHIVPLLGSGTTYVEPFCGGLSVGSRAAEAFDRVILADARAELIVLYKAWLEGWRPEPLTLAQQEERHQEIRKNPDPSSPETAFYLIGLSFGGMWGGGFARDGARDCVQTATRSLQKKMDRFAGRDVTFLASDYRALDIPDGAVVYCDPPYAGTEGYRGLPAFDHEEFWAWATDLSGRCSVFVSELTSPEGWEVVWQKDILSPLNPELGTRPERVYRRAAGLVLGELSAEAKAARAPLPPEELVDALHDSVHRDPGRARAARTVRNSRHGTTPADAEDL